MLVERLEIFDFKVTLTKGEFDALKEEAVDKQVDVVEVVALALDRYLESLDAYKED